ncbi:unnamed protein product [Tuber aestivum]|uniref:Uncharacterized protein n=1 Tax=Tuber aestivum TaxID=59557 RepID=A0A292PVA3_9PEZI|nr:unnamed protein product [Tuber aestivum]
MSLTNPSNLDKFENSNGCKHDSPGSAVRRCGGRRGSQGQVQESRFEGEVIGSTNGYPASRNAACSLPHTARPDTTNSSPSSSLARSPVRPVAHVLDYSSTLIPSPKADATLTSDPQMSSSDLDGGSEWGCGGGGDGTADGRDRLVSSSASQRPQRPPRESSSPSSTDPPLSPFHMDHCIGQSYAASSHNCLPNSHQDHHQHQHQNQQQQRHRWQQIDLSTARDLSETEILPAASPREAPAPSDDHHHHHRRHCSGVSARQQGIASTAVADQDYLPFESIPSSWNKSSPSPAPSFGSPLSSTPSSNLSSETEFGGALITPGDLDGLTGANKHQSSPLEHSKSSPDQEACEEDSDGGVDVDLFDSDMESIEVTRSPLPLPPTLHVPNPIDEDEEDFSPSNLVTRPPSPVGGGAAFLDFFSSSPSPTDPSPHEGPADNGSENANDDEAPGDDDDPVFLMQLDPPLEEFGFAQDHSSSPAATQPDNYLHSGVFGVHGSMMDPLSEILVTRSFEGQQEGSTMEDEALESEASQTPGWNESMPSQSPQTPPTTAAAVPPSSFATLVTASGEFPAAAGVGEAFPTSHSPPPSPPPLIIHDDFNPFTNDLNPFTIYTPTPPHPLSPSPTPFAVEFPLHFSTTYLSLPPVVLDGGVFTEDEEIEGITDHTFEQNLPLEDIENYNYDFAKFCLHAYCRYRMNPARYQKLSVAAADVRKLPRPREITKRDVERDGCDIQAIPWQKLGITVDVARGVRRKEYINYRNEKDVEPEQPPSIPENRQFYKFRRMDTEQKPRLIHFQLRNLLGVVSRSDVFYAGNAKVLRTNPLTGSTVTTMDLSYSDSWSGNQIRISTLSACTGQSGVVIAGCFHGEYAMKPLFAQASAQPITGIVTKNESGITNHVQIVRNRHNNTPNAVFSSNDCHVRVLDCETLAFNTQHEYDWAVNCSVMSPDSRLRVVVGDHTDVLICDAERGSTQFVLPGHRDYGFAAAWSDDGHTIATGNQDETVRIWDARKLNETMKVLPAKMAGVRALRFSPLGYGGKRVLAMAEPADIVQIVDATSWDSMQQLEFWGEVGGIEFAPTGEEFFIANADKCVGGLMEFERCKGRAYYQEYPESDSGREVLSWEDAMDEEEGDTNGPGRRGRGNAAPLPSFSLPLSLPVCLPVCFFGLPVRLSLSVCSPPSSLPYGSYSTPPHPPHLILA